MKFPRFIWIIVSLYGAACAVTQSDQASIVATSDRPIASVERAEPSSPSIALMPWIEIDRPITYLTHAGDGSQRLFLVEKQGRVLIIKDNVLQEAPFLDIVDLVLSGGFEQGLLSIAFAPDFATSGQFYVNYTAKEGGGDSVIARYQVSADADLADHASAEIILQLDQPARNHNGGQIKFGPDGYLYIGTGDGGMAGDPWDNAENKNHLLGKMLRIDVSTSSPYLIPFDNPFVDETDVRPEVWAYGLRNPWRFSFDRLTGDLYIADVGQNQWEEINFQAADSQGGEHYGWDSFEGSHCYEGANDCQGLDSVLPLVEYGHGAGCSVTGGYVYRGQDFPAWQGFYLFADYCSGRLWSVSPREAAERSLQEVLSTGIRPASFGEDEAGELYILDLEGKIYRLVEPSS